MAIGGIDFAEFCRFATERPEPSPFVELRNDPKLVTCMKEAFATQLPSLGAETFANVFKRMCLIADKDNTGMLSAAKLEKLFEALDIALPRKSKKVGLLCLKIPNGGRTDRAYLSKPWRTMPIQTMPSPMIRSVKFTWPAWRRMARTMAKRRRTKTARQ